jgi:hypothetical protein
MVFPEMTASKAVKLKKQEYNMRGGLRGLDQRSPVYCNFGNYEERRYDLFGRPK